MIQTNTVFRVFRLRRVGEGGVGWEKGDFLGHYTPRGTMKSMTFYIIHHYRY